VISEQNIDVGFAFDSTKDITPVGLLKINQFGVLENGEFVYGKQYLGQASPISLHLQI
jgi:hypothetical protein